MDYNRRAMIECAELSHDDYLYHCLSSAYLDLLSKKEKGEITVNEVGRKAGVSRSVFYRLFGSRDYQRILTLHHLRFLFEKDKANLEAKPSLSLFFAFLYRHLPLFGLLFEKDELSVLAFFAELAEKERELFFLPSLFNYLKKEAKEGYPLSEEEALMEAYSLLAKASKRESDKKS